MISTAPVITSGTANQLRFVAPSTFIDPSFWEELYHRKLNVYKLGTDQETLFVAYTCSDGNRPESFLVEGTSFDHKGGWINEKVRVEGSLTNVNTVEEFKNFDKKKLLEDCAAHIWQSIVTLDAMRDPRLLQRFVLLTFADLKSYRFTYWFASPALLPAASVPFDPFQPPKHLFQSDSDNGSYWWTGIVAMYRGVPTTLTTSESKSLSSPSPLPPVFVLSTTAAGSWQVTTLADSWDRLLAETNSSDLFVVVADTASDDVSSFGWQLRNVLALLGTHMRPATTVSIIALRGSVAKRMYSCECDKVAGLVAELPDEALVRADRSVLLKVVWPDSPSAYRYGSGSSSSSGTSEESEEGRETLPLPRVVGWESNERGKPGPRVADLSAMMDSQQLMEQVPHRPRTLIILLVILLTCNDSC